MGFICRAIPIVLKIGALLLAFWLLSSCVDESEKMQKRESATKWIQFAELPEELQAKALEHELEHIRLGHFYNEDPVGENEREAG